MFNIDTLKDCWAGLVGFISNSAAHGIVDDDLSQSTTGIYADQRTHSLFSAGNLMNAAELYGAADVPAWDAESTYAKGQLVNRSGGNPAVTRMYISLQDDNTDQDPETETAYWKQTSRLNAFYRNVYEGAVAKLANRIATTKKLNEAAKTMLKDVVLYEGVGNIRERLTKRGRFVGFRIALKAQDITAILSRIGLQITQQQTLTVYLYHSSSDQPITTFALAHDKAVQFKWHNVTQTTLDFLNDTINAGGKWYLGYYEDDLTGEAISKQIQFDGNWACTSCNQANANIYRLWSKYFEIQPFYVNETDLNPDKSLWDEEQEFYVDDMTFGLNVQMSVRCDLTHFLCRNADLMADALSKQITCDLLEVMAYSMRDNQARERMAGLAAMALQSPDQPGVGAKAELDKAVKALNFDISNVGSSSLCMPCDNRNKIGFRSAYGR